MHSSGGGSIEGRGRGLNKYVVQICDACEEEHCFSFLLRPAPDQSFIHNCPTTINELLFIDDVAGNVAQGKISPPKIGSY